VKNVRAYDGLSRPVHEPGTVGTAAAAIAVLPARSCVVDGEAVAVDDNGWFSDSLFKLTTFVVIQRDDNPIPTATDELERVVIIARDFVYIMPHRRKHMDRFVVSPPIHRHIFVMVLLTEHALDCFLVGSTRTHWFALSYSIA
jgi:hypothetical protein